MPSSSPDVDDQEIKLLTALKTTFSKHADPELFLARAADKITDLERTIIETCSKNRIRIDDNLYALLESRDSISEQRQDIDTATESASEITKNVDKAVAALTEKMQVRQNLDAALAVAAQTRKLTRMYARIEDTIDSRRLYTAFRMLKVLEEETRCVKPGTILQELVPDSHRLRSTITLHARKAFHSWLSAVRKSEAELGAYALFDANKKIMGPSNLITTSRLGSMNDTYAQLHGLSPSKTHTDAARDVGRTRAWSPLLTSNPVPSSIMLPRNLPQRSFSSHRVAVMSPLANRLPPEATFRPEIGGDGRSGMRSFANEYQDAAPTLHLRPLLQSVLVNGGLELLGDMRADYRRERDIHLRKMLDEVIGIGGESGLPERESPHQMGPVRAREIETFVFRVCGFFVVERAVEKHADPTVVQRTVVNNEWWGMAYPRMQALLKEQDDAAMHSPADKAWARSLQGDLDRFAEANELR